MGLNPRRNWQTIYVDGAAPVVLNEARQCLQAIDAVLSESALDDEAFASYVKLNEQFHALLSELSANEASLFLFSLICPTTDPRVSVL